MADDGTGGAALSDSDRDLLIRTVIGEAGNQPDVGKAAVANVVLNRMAANGYGNSVRSVVLAPNQFEPWSARGSELMSISPKSDAYQKTGKIVDAVASGGLDVTGGATHFYAPLAQAAMGRRPPSWDDGSGLAIGGHLFFAPNGSIDRNAAGSAIDKAMGVRNVDLGTALPYTATTPGNSPNIPGAATGSGKNTGNISDDALLQMYGPKAAAAPVPPAGPANATGGVPGATVTPSTPAPLLTDDDLLAKYGPKAQPAGPDAPSSIDAAKAAIPANAAGQIELLAANRQLPDAIANNSIANIASATGADPQALRNYFDAYKGRPVSTSDAIGEGLKQGATLGTGPAIGGAIEAATGGRPFAQGMAARVGDLKNAEAAHPYASLGGEIAGSLPTLAVAGATAIGGRALGLTGNMLTRVPSSVATNMLLGASDSAIRSGGDWNEIGSGAKWGGATGFLAPMAGKAVGSGVNMLTNTLGNPMTGARAENALLRVLETSGQTPQSIAADLAQNPRLAMMDVNGGAQEIAKGLASTPGKASATLRQAYDNRAGSAAGAVAGAFDDALGATPDVKAVLDGLQATARTNASKGFGSALNGAPPVDTSKVISAIDAKVNPIVNQVAQTPGYQLGPQESALLRIKSMLTDGNSVLTDPNKLHAVQSSIRSEAQDLLSSATGSDRQVGKAMMDARGNLVGAIDDAAGGKYKPALSQYADDMSVKDAFNKGLDVFRNRAGAAGLEDRPEYWRDAISKMSPDEVASLKQGVRTAVDQKIGAARNGAAAGEAITNSDLNQSKLAAILGDREAGQLAQRLSDEQRMSATNRILFQGSQTEPRQKAAASIAARNLGPLTLETGVPMLAGYMGGPYAAAGAAGLALARRGVQYAGRQSDLARNNLLAGMVSASGADVSPVIAALNNRLMANANAGQGFGAGVNLLMDAARPAFDPGRNPLISQVPPTPGTGPRLPYHGR